MLTPGSRFFFGFAAFALVGAFVYGFASGGDQPLMDHILGPLTLGWKGGVGDHFGYIVLVTAAAVSAFLGALVVAFRDADPEATAAVLETETAPLTRAPADASYWPLLGAFAVAVMLVGFIVGPELLLVGAVLALVAVVEWTVKAWSERATGDPVANRELRNRLMVPLEVPIGGLLAVAVVFLGVSRVLLAVSKTGAVVIGGAVATLMFVACIALAARPAMRRSVLSVVVVLFGLSVVGGGIAAAVIGERDFEHHSGEGEGGEGHSEAESGDEGAGNEGEPAEGDDESEPAGDAEEQGMTDAGARAAGPAGAQS
jgi:hypothetical protein